MKGCSVARLKSRGAGRRVPRGRPAPLDVWLEGLPHDGVAVGRNLVEAPHRRRVRSALRDARVLARLVQDRVDRLGESIERLAGLRLGRLDHQRLVDQEWEIDRRRVHAEVEQALRDVECLDAELLLRGRAGEYEL